MPSKQKTKGSGFEREIAKDLTTRYGENFVRTIGSGAFTGGSNRFRKDSLTENQARHHKGDVTPPDSFFRMNMECKFYSDLLFHQIFQGSCSQLDTWIGQTYDAADEGDINIIAIKVNRKGKFICIEKNENLKLERGLEYKGWYFFDYDTFFDDNLIPFADICGK